MSGVQAAQGAICCCKVVPFAPCDYFEARAWYLSNPTEFPSISAAVLATQTDNRYLVSNPDFNCGDCFGKESNETWVAGPAILQRVPVLPQAGIFPVFARWVSAWSPAGSITQIGGLCTTTLGCCGGCCNNSDPFFPYGMPPDCIPNTQQQTFLCQFNGGRCDCLMPYTYPMPATYYYGCGNEEYQAPSPCASCSSRTVETGTRVRPPGSIQLLYRIVVEIGGWDGPPCIPSLPACPPPFVSGVTWMLKVERGSRIICGDGNDAIVGGRILPVWGRTCCNYRAGPAGSYAICTGTQPASGSSSSVQACDGLTRTWQYGLTASVS